VFDYASDQAGGSFMEMNEYNGSTTPYVGQSAVRTSGAFTEGSGTLSLPDGQTIAYAAGDDIAVTLGQYSALGGGPFGFPNSTTAAPFATGGHGTPNGMQQIQHYTNYTSGQTIAWTNDTVANSTPDPLQATYNDSGMSGLTALVSFTPVTSYTYTGTAPTAPTGLLSWSYWNTNFGTAPKATTKITNTSTGVQALLQPTTYTIAFP